MFSMKPVPANMKLRPPLEPASPVGASEPYGNVANARSKQAVASKVNVTERERDVASSCSADAEVGLSLPVPSTVEVNVVRPSSAVPMAMVDATELDVLYAA